MSDTVLVIDVGDGARMFVPQPNSMNDDGIEWRLRYGNAHEIRLQAASVIATTSYLISDYISTTEAIRRLRIMRREYKAACQKSATPPATQGEAK